MIDALGFMCFCGSQTLGWLKAGYNVKGVLEMTNDMNENNSYHFIKNYPEIPIILPQVWENDEDYLKQYKNIDVTFSNPPCSGLSSINRNMSIDADVNNNIFRYINAIDVIEPKVFMFENSPNLVTLGLPILKKIQDKVGDRYRLTIITDLAGNHSVPMQRRRTLVIGWNNNYFCGIPNIDQVKERQFTVQDALYGIDDSIPNMEFDKNVHMKSLMRFYNLVEPNQSILKVLSHNYDKIKNDLSEKELHEVDIFRNRYLTKSSVWDKSAWRLPLDGLAPSLASVVQFMHPVENRDLYIREYARLMGYPDDFIFYPNECKLTTIQCIAQGVPVNFINYIALQIKNAFTNNVSKDVVNNVIYINQTSGIQKITKFKDREFQECKKINVNEQLIKEVSLF